MLEKQEREQIIAFAFDLPDRVMLVSETLFAKIPKVMQMTEATVRAFIKGDVQQFGNRQL